MAAILLEVSSLKTSDGTLFTLWAGLFSLHIEEVSELSFSLLINLLGTLSQLVCPFTAIVAPHHNTSPTQILWLLRKKDETSLVAIMHQLTHTMITCSLADADSTQNAHLFVRVWSCGAQPPWNRPRGNATFLQALWYVWTPASAPVSLEQGKTSPEFTDSRRTSPY